MEKPPVDSLDEYHDRGLELLVTCRRCGHSARQSPSDLARHCRDKGATSMADVVGRLYCRKCKLRDFHVEPIPKPGRTTTQDWG